MTPQEAAEIYAATLRDEWTDLGAQEPQPSRRNVTHHCRPCDIQRTAR
jgi:hypothetical protein